MSTTGIEPVAPRFRFHSACVIDTYTPLAYEWHGKGEQEDLSAADLKRIVKLLEELTNG